MSESLPPEDLKARLLTLIDQEDVPVAEKEVAKKIIANAIQDPLVARILNTFVGNG
jgi:hypothetical protein